MERLLHEISVFVSLLQPDRIEAIAANLERTGSLSSVQSSVGTPAAEQAIARLDGEWRQTNTTPRELALMLRAASMTRIETTSEQSIELVWTGPKTPGVSPRRTEQALLEIIEQAKKSIFITSFVAYEVSSLVEAFNRATTRGVEVNILLESSKDDGGSIDTDSIGRMRRLAPQANLYAWRKKDSQFAGGRVHAKIAVADKTICLITSANLTAFAMEINMEAGLLVRGGSIPESIHNHLLDLILTNEIFIC